MTHSWVQSSNLTSYQWPNVNLGKALTSISSQEKERASLSPVNKDLYKRQDVYFYVRATKLGMRHFLEKTDDL